jgi:GT2 family glycosyltransferase
MKISAITVCWNAEKTIRHTVESFLAQDYPNREMVIVDGLSKDTTLDIVKSYNSPLITIHSGKDKGIYDAMNKGLKLYTGDAVGFLNADDVYHTKQTLSHIAAGLKTKPGCHLLENSTLHEGCLPARLGATPPLDLRASRGL